MAPRHRQDYLRAALGSRSEPKRSPDGGLLMAILVRQGQAEVYVLMRTLTARLLPCRPRHH
jgi:hypothetical protein